jgi:cytochrome c oxidase cbb3-type subunit 3
MSATARTSALLLLALACQRERRQLAPAPAESAASSGVVVSELRPAAPPTNIVSTLGEDQTNAYAISEGKRLYQSYNCVGCHAHGGGAIGPPLMDDEWIYGVEADQIFSSIVEGRPNGMPTFRGKIPDFQVWQIAAYVRSMGGLVPKDVAPNRDDHISGPPPESSTTRQQPVNSTLPPAAVQ